MPWDNLAILIPTRNRPAILATTLKELAKVGLKDAALWVYDDASEKPQAVQDVVKTWPGGRIIRGEQRVGQAAGRNVLLRACGKEYGLLLDDDSFPASAEGLVEHLAGSRTPERPAIVTFQYKSMADGKLSRPACVPAGPAGCFSGGGSVFHIPSVLGVGGFRDFFTYGYEEPELSMRLWLRGLTIWYDPRVVINHNHFETPDERRDYREYDYLYARNGILMSSLNMPFWFGLPHGLARSLRLSLRLRRNVWARARRTRAGLWLAFCLRQERTPCRFGQALAWCRFVRRA
ncbi:MAG: glycosyltransferase [Verrucomicrobia bacterium]|nr:glycosyltransferase [Verrucomicrobiota bacterium]